MERVEGQADGRGKAKGRKGREGGGREGFKGGNIAGNNNLYLWYRAHGFYYLHTKVSTASFRAYHDLFYFILKIRDIQSHLKTRGEGCRRMEKQIHETKLKRLIIEEE
jgi:hypothetical protein